MSGFVKSTARKVENFHREISPAFHRAERRIRERFRRLLKRPRSVSESPNLLPLLIQVLAAFSKVDGEILEEEIDSSLGFLRYDYPDAVYSELRAHFRQALHEQQDLDAMAQRLARELEPDRKILLCVQLYDLISKAGLQKQQVAAYYTFMSKLGMAAQAIDIVYQLNADGETGQSVTPGDASPLESLVFGPDGEKADVTLSVLEPGERIHAYRHHDLILLKNLTSRPIHVRGRSVRTNGFCRIYNGQRIIIGEQVILYQELVFYFNAKKNVSVPRLYLKVNQNDEVELLRSKDRDSMLEVTFGLSVQVKALRDIDAALNGRKLKQGKTVEAKLEDVIVFHDDTELPLGDLRRRARAMGGRFTLQASKSEYLVSNNPALLEADDILLSPGTSGEVLLKIFCDYERKCGRVEVLQADRPITVRQTPVRNSAPLEDGDLIRIDAGQVLRCDFGERIIEERRNIIRSLDVSDLGVVFPGGQTGLDSVSFSVARGEMVCVMGASGSGKSTLLQSLAGQLSPRSGEIRLNGMSLYPNLEALKGYVSYVPQDDAFDEHLTIEENLEFAAAIRAPHLTSRDRARRVDGKLIELGLSERRDSLVGSPTRKRLSGGERKRLNIGLDMIGNADVYLFDEPTSGLSSKDSEHVVDIIRGMSHNKIVLVTIHQPSARLFHMFQKALLLDKGGRLVFYGTPTEMLEYFSRAEHEQHFGNAEPAGPIGAEVGPEFVFDVLESPLRDLSGDIIYEENQHGQLVPARRYSPEYWRDKYESHRLLQDVRQVPLQKEDSPAELPPIPANRTRKIRWRDEWTQFRSLLGRAFMSKTRNRANLLTTVVEAPLLAALFGVVLRYSESGDYDFASAYHIPTYLFLSLVVAMFLGLTNSADDIIRDRSILRRERNLDVRLGYYILAKVLPLALFAAIQCVLFVWIGNWILEIRGMFLDYFLYLFITALNGVAIGLLISSLVSDAKTAANILPLVLIPQIFLGGALIKYEEMNRNLDLVYLLSRWAEEQPGAPELPKSELEVPWICQFMPMRWSYEAIVVAQAKHNPLTSRQNRLQNRLETLNDLVDADPDNPESLQALNQAKEMLALVSGLQGDSPPDVDRKLKLVERYLEGEPPDWNTLRSGNGEVTAESLYVNQKVSDLVSTAEMEQMDYSLQRKINVFFGPVKHYFDSTWSVYGFNVVILTTSTLFILVALHASLKWQLQVRS